MTPLEQVLDSWINDPAFRAEFERDPEAAVQRGGFALSEGEWRQLRAAQAGLGHELQSRSNRPFFG